MPSHDGIDKMHSPNVAHILMVLEARQHKEKHLATRLHWFQRALNADFRNTYDKLAHQMGHSILPHQTTDRIKERHKKLHKLFSLGNV